MFARLLNPLQPRHFAQQVANLVAVEFSGLGYPVDVANQVRLGPDERLEGRIARDTCQQTTIRRQSEFLDSRGGPVFVEQTAEDRREHAAGFNRPELAGAVPPDLLWFSKLFAR